MEEIRFLYGIGQRHRLPCRYLGSQAPCYFLHRTKASTPDQLCKISKRHPPVGDRLTGWVWRDDDRKLLDLKGGRQDVVQCSDESWLITQHRSTRSKDLLDVHERRRCVKTHRHRISPLPLGIAGHNGGGMRGELTGNSRINHLRTQTPARGGVKKN